MDNENLISEERVFVNVQKQQTNHSEAFINYYTQKLETENKFYFSVAGDYSPTLMIWFYNDTTVQYTYNDIKLHVASATEVQSLKMENINVVIAVALLVFAFVEGISVVNELTKNNSHDTCRRYNIQPLLVRRNRDKKNILMVKKFSIG
jgi:hypothetical protein